MKLIDLTLPTFAWLDGNSHDGNHFENREVFIHIPTKTIFEVFCIDEIQVMLDVRSTDFQFEGLNYKIAIHYTLLQELDNLINQAIAWYKLESEFIEENMRGLN